MAHDGLRRFLETRAGAAGRALLAWRTRGRAESLLQRRGIRPAALELALTLDARVQRGPFVGMHYPRARGDIVHAAKLLGAYECELHSTVEMLIARAPRLVVNVGSGDGYYVVGLARRLPTAVIIAVDPDPLAQRACARAADRNEVGSRVSHVVRVDQDALGALLGAGTGRTLCVVDCEGYEDELLDPERVPALRASDLLVETHDFARPGVTSRLTERFAASHDVRRIEVAARDPRGFPELSGYTNLLAGGLLDEFRHHPQSWLALTARS
jgi:hypothetical protein